MIERAASQGRSLRWTIDKVEGPRLIGVPGLAFGPKGPEQFLVGRSHLPLIDTAGGMRNMLRFVASQVWERRNERTEPLGFKLRTTQQQGIDFVKPRRGVLIGDDMRTGKSLIAIMSHDPATGQLVVIAPLMSRAMWLGWLRRVFPGAEIGVLLGKQLKPDVLDKPIVFGHYDILHGWQSLNMKIGTLVLDEAHALCNRGPELSKRAEAASLIALKAECVIAMTGTPIWNKPAGMWNILNLCLPGEWGSYYDFALRYGDPQPTAYGNRYEGISNADELNERLSEVMLRRRWVDVQADLPPITRSVKIADLDDAARRRLDIEAAAVLDGGSKNTAATLASYRKVASRFKVKATVAEAKTLLSRGEPVVVWTWHVDTAKEIAKVLGDQAICITGEDLVPRREKLFTAWKESPVPLALVVNMAVAREAIDLSHSKFPIFCELSETPAIVGQAEMRTFHPSRPMHVTFIVANHIVDHRLVMLLERKLTAATAIGVGTASDSIEAIRNEVFGLKDEGDLSRMLEDLFAGDDA